MANGTNEKVKRKYFKWLRGAKGYSEKTIVKIERAIHLFEESTNFKDFKTYTERQATKFKECMTDKELSNTTKYHHLRHLNSFFSWLATQPGYKSKIQLDAVSYLCLDRKARIDALAKRTKKFPSKEYVLKLVNSIENKTDIERRDKALVSCMFITGMRVESLCSLSIQCIDLEKMVVYQDPKLGVKTKMGKPIITYIFRFDDELVQNLTNWILYLQDTLQFSPSDPVFPQTNIIQTKEGYSFEPSGLKPEFWSTGNSIRDILKLRAKNADLPYFNPHRFRDAAIQYGLKFTKTPEQFKAFSQNFGHESIMTTLRSYGTLDDYRIEDIITKMTFDDNIQENVNIPVDLLLEFLKSNNIKLD